MHPTRLITQCPQLDVAKGVAEAAQAVLVPIHHHIAQGDIVQPALERVFIRQGVGQQVHGIVQAEPQAAVTFQLRRAVIVLASAAAFVGTVVENVHIDAPAVFADIVFAAVGGAAYRHAHVLTFVAQVNLAFQSLFALAAQNVRHVAVDRILTAGLDFGHPVGTGLAAGVVHQDACMSNQISVGVFHLDVVNRGAVRLIMQCAVGIFA